MAQIKDLFWRLQVILFYKELLLFSSGRLASGIRRWNTGKLFLKLCSKCGYSTPTVAGLEQGRFSLLVSLWHQLCRGRIRQECYTKDWPLVSNRLLKAGCTDFPSDQPTCGAAWALGEGKKVELIRFPALK